MPKSNNRIHTYYIYLITNNINEKNYVGKHKCPLSKTPWTDYSYMGMGVAIRAAEKKYGIENFSKDILAICYSEEENCILEKCYIALYKSIGKAEYNLTDGGEGGGTYWYYKTEEELLETRKKLSASVKKTCSTKEHRKKISESKTEWWKNHIISKEEHERRSNSLKGRKLSKECKMKIGLSGKGKKHSDETKKKLSDKLKGRKLSEEHKIKLSNSKKGKKISDSVKEKIKISAKRRSLLCKMSLENWRKDILTYWRPKREYVPKYLINQSKCKMHWYNNGTECMRAKECPTGFVKGRLGNFTCSEEAKKKKSDWWKNLSEEEKVEYKKHLSESHKGKPFSEERKRHISEAKKGCVGRKKTEEEKRKIAETVRKRWAEKNDYSI